MSPADAARLQAVYRRETCGLLQYVPGAAPYAGPDVKALGTVNHAAAEEAAELDRLAGLLDTNRVTIPLPGSFPVGFTDLNFVSVRSLLPRLVAEQKRATGELETDRDALTDPAARDALQRLVDLHRKHLLELESTTS